MSSRFRVTMLAPVMVVTALVVALWAVGGIGPRYAGEPLGHWLRELAGPDYRCRAQAETALAALGPDAVPDLTRALHLDDRRVGAWLGIAARRVLGLRPDPVPKAALREQAALLLARLGDRAAPAAPDLVALLVDADPAPARAAQTALRRIGPAAVPALVLALEHASPPVRRHVLELLGDRQHFSDPTVDPLDAILASLRDGDADVRAVAATTVGRWGRVACRGADDLGHSLKDPAMEVRLAAARSLGELGPCAASAVTELIKQFEEPDSRLQVEVARALWRIARETDTAVPVLIAALSSSEVHWQAALALGEIGPPAALAIPTLLTKLESEIAHRPARTPPSAALALAKLGPRAVPGLTALLRHRQAEVRVAAAFALAGHGPDAHAAVPDLMALLDEADNEMRITAANTLGAIGPPARAATTQLHHLARDGDEYLRAAALGALKQIEDGHGPSPPEDPGQDGGNRAAAPAMTSLRPSAGRPPQQAQADAHAALTASP